MHAETLNPSWAGGFGAKPNFVTPLVSHHNARNQNPINIIMMYVSRAMHDTVQSMRPDTDALGSRADEVRLHSASWAATADCAVSLLIHTSAEVLAGQRMSRMKARTTLAWLVLGRQLLQ